GYTRIMNCTFVDDSVTGASFYLRELCFAFSACYLRNTIFAHTMNQTSLACFACGMVYSEGGNICDDESFTNFLPSLDLSETAPGLGVFGQHGGFTRTWSLLASSPAIDFGGQGVPLVDQRGFA